MTQDLTLSLFLFQTTSHESPHPAFSGYAPRCVDLGEFPELREGIILVDCDEPAFDMLSAICGHYQLPIIALVRPGHGEAALNAGAWEYLVKEQLTEHLLAYALRVISNQQRLTTQVTTVGRALVATEVRFNNLIEKNQDGIVVVDGEGVICYINRASEELFGRSADQLLGNHLGFPVTAGEMTEMEILHKSGQVATVELRVMDNEWEGNPAYLLSLRDITTRKSAENELREREKLMVALEKEKEMSLVKSQFMTTISHEFRTPLTVIQSGSDLLDHYYDRLTPEKRQNHLRTIKAQVKHLEAMLADISIIVHSEQGKLAFQPIPINIKLFCRNTIDDIKQAIGAQHNLFFDFDEDDDYDVLGDPKLLTHIVNNLLSNAIKYSKPDTDIHLALSREKSDIAIRVTDQGIGIPEADQKRLFEAFHRASNVGTISGTGIGLKVVKDCVALHGGTFNVESTEGVGTNCTVRIPSLNIN